VQKALARKELTAEKKAEDVLRYIHAAMFFCPADYFDPGGEGGWLISREDYRALPAAVKCLIEEMELRQVTTRAGTSAQLWVRFVSKGQAMTLAAKHQLGQKLTVYQNQIDWSELFRRTADDDPQVCAVENRLRAIEAECEAVPQLPGPTSNGHNGGA
jgi:hypothetical protein